MRVFFTTVLLGWMVLEPAHAIDEHAEFDTVLQVPFQSDSAGQRRVVMRFSPPDNHRHLLRWRLELLPRHDETVVRSWRGERMLDGEAAEVSLIWRAAVPDGVYRMRLRARLDD